MMARDRVFKTKAKAKKYMKSKRLGKPAADGHVRQLKKTKLGWTVYRN